MDKIEINKEIYKISISIEIISIRKDSKFILLILLSKEINKIDKIYFWIDIDFSIYLYRYYFEYLLLLIGIIWLMVVKKELGI